MKILDVCMAESPRQLTQQNINGVQFSMLQFEPGCNSIQRGIKLLCFLATINKATVNFYEGLGFISNDALESRILMHLFAKMKGSAAESSFCVRVVDLFDLNYFLNF